MGSYSVLMRGAHLPPAPISGILNSVTMRWDSSKNSLRPNPGMFGILMAFGTRFCHVGRRKSGPVNREIQHPKLKNLKRAAIVIAIYSLIFTGGATLLASMLIPTLERTHIYQDNLIAASQCTWSDRVLAHCVSHFCCIRGFLILSGAINTSMIGSTAY